MMALLWCGITVVGFAEKAVESKPTPTELPPLQSVQAEKQSSAVTTDGTQPNLELSPSVNTQLPTLTPLSSLESTSTEASKNVSTPAAKVAGPLVTSTPQKSKPQKQAAKKPESQNETAASSPVVLKNPQPLEQSVQSAPQKATKPIVGGVKTTTQTVQNILPAEEAPLTLKDKAAMPILEENATSVISPAALEDAPVLTDMATPSEKPEKPKVVYTPLQAIAVFPVLFHGNERAFGDVAILFANGFAEQLEGRFPQTTVHHPVYSVESLRLKGLDRLYNQMMAYYLRAGQPEPRALKFILSELSAGGPDIQRVAFVSADVDLHHMNRSFRPKDLIKKYQSDALPAEQRYYVNTLINVYNVDEPTQPKIWTHKWSIPVKTTGIYNVTSSVFDDSDSLSQFSAAARNMGRLSVLAVPKGVYMESSLETDTHLAGEILKPNVTSVTLPVSEEINRQTQQELRRLLQSSR